MEKKEKQKKQVQENNTGKEKNIDYSMWERYQINERIKTGYEKYMETTKPVLNFYSRNPNFKEIDGSLEIDEITRKIDTFINV